MIGTLATEILTTRVAKVIFGILSTSSALFTLLFFCVAIGAMGSNSYDKSNQITGSLLLMFINAAWMWASLVAYASVEKLREHCRKSIAERTAATLVAEIAEGNPVT